jgi:hypothetical protein
LDLVVFGVLKAIVGAEDRKFVHENPDRSVKMDDAAAMLLRAWDHLSVRAVGIALAQQFDSNNRCQILSVTIVPPKAVETPNSLRTVSDTRGRCCFKEIER